MIEIVIKDIIQSRKAVTSEKARLVFDILKQNIEIEEVSKLNFTEVESLTTAFLNIAIGQLYDLEDPEKLSDLVRIDRSSVTDDHFKKIIRVLSNSKKKREINKKNVQEILDCD